MKDFVDITHLFNKCCGVYVLYQGDVVVYVGQSRNLIMRINQHRRDTRFSFSKVLVRYCEVHQLDRFETDLIRELRPTNNRVLYKASDVGFIPIKPVDLLALGFDVNRYAWAKRGAELPVIRD